MKSFHANPNNEDLNEVKVISLSQSLIDENMIQTRIRGSRNEPVSSKQMNNVNNTGSVHTGTESAWGIMKRQNDD